MATRQASVLIDPTDDLLITWAEEGNSAYSCAKVPGLIDTLKAADCVGPLGYPFESSAH